MDLQNYTIDPGCLAIYDSSVFSPGTTSLSTSELGQMALKAYRVLLEKVRDLKSLELTENSLKKLEHKNIDFDKNPNEIELPKSSLEIPRLLKYELSKKMTKWEKFAKDKGIKKVKKRSRMVWSEELGDWVPRWGPNSARRAKEELSVVREVRLSGEKGQRSFRGPV